MRNFSQRVVFPRFILATLNIAAVVLCGCLVTCHAQVQGTQPLVAIHDSELTRALETMPAVAPTPTGAGTTGFQWWPTNWHYFVMPEALQEMLRSDGTAYKVIRDSDITAGLLNPDGSPKYPIVISLAAEAVRDDELVRLTDYVSAGGFLFVGGSSFTRNPNGTTRGDFAIANAMGLHVISSSLANWGLSMNLTKQTSHRLVNHLPGGQLTWRLPASSEEISWGLTTGHPFQGAHQIWRAQASDATVLAQGDNYPYLTVKKYGNGYIIYCSAFQPVIAHGGFGPGMYAYAIFRNAIEWASETAGLPVVKLSPWPYQFDAAFVIRHDLENFSNAISHIELSAQYEQARAVKGDYYFCTGTLRDHMAGTFNVSSVIASLQRAMSQYGATIGPHNGGLSNPSQPLSPSFYDYWHWGPDEALDFVPPGYPNGRTYALASISNSFADIERWLPGQMTNGLRIWAAPYFNATREDSYALQEQLGVKITGDQKLSPLPHWTLSTRTSGKRYVMLSQPVSDWFVGGLVAQSLEPWHPPGVQTSATLHQAIDFYYGMGLFLNFYSHTLSTGEGDAGALLQDYIDYCMNASLHPRMWAANGIGIYDWWARRSTAQMAVTYSTNGSQFTTTISITGATDANTAVELLAPSTNALASVQVYRNGNLTPANGYRVNGRVLKVPIGTTINNVQIIYSLGAPIANPDSYSTTQGTALIVPSPGVLGNDPGAGGATAQLAIGPAHGTLNLNANGGFTYTPASGYSGTDSFVYQANTGGNLSGPATVTITIVPTGTLLLDTFTRANIAPWVQRAGAWGITNNALTGTSLANDYGNAYYDASGWTDYTVSARVGFSTIGGYGGGIGGRLNPTTGAHYTAWVYPEGSTGGSAGIALIKFSGWTTWSGTPVQQVTLPSVGTALHAVALTMNGNNISISFDGTTVINVTDNNIDGMPAFTGGGISADMWTGATAYSLIVDDVSVTSLAGSSAPTINTQPQSQTVTAGQSATFSVVATGAAPLSYQWRFNGNAIGGATGTSYTRTNAQSATAGNYTVVVTNSFGSVTSAIATLTVNASGTPPAINTQPQSQTVTAGQNATFSVGATGTAPLNYQWRFNGTAIGGAASTSYTRTNAQSADAGNYSVIVTNSFGSVTSAVATLTVNAASTPPSITTQPQSQTVTVGQNATFSVGASGTAPLNYQWRFNGTAIGGATGTTYTRTNVQSANAGNYTVIVTNSFGSVTSAVATLTVNSNSVLFSDTFTRTNIAPWIQRAGTWSITTNALTGTSVANDYGNAYYDASGWTDYTVSARIGFSTIGGYGGGIGGRLNPTTGAHYGAWVYPESAVGGSAAIALVKFSGWTTWSGTPVQQVTLPSVGTALHTVALTMNGSNITISFDGATVINVTDNNIDGIPPFTGGGISADMWTGATAYSLIVDDVSVASPVGGLAPTINTQPQSQTITAGQNATFSVSATGTAPLNYQWRFNGTAIGGATTTSYTRTNAQSADAGNYTVIVSNSFGSVTSAVATLTVNAANTPPSITAQPQSLTVTAGQNATFSVGASGTAPLNYQWRFNGTAIGGATGTSYTRTNSQSANAGNYTVIVTNSFGSVTSAIATLTVNVAGTPPSIIGQPQSQTVTAGQNASFSVNASGTAPLNYQWRFNGTTIGGATGTSYIRTNAQSANAGNYTVLVTNSFGSVTSAVATLTVTASNTPPSITIQPQPQTVTAGQNATFSVTANGTAPLRYAWRLNNASLGATNSSYTVTNAQSINAGNYSVVVLNDVGLVVSSNAALVVNAPAVPPSITSQPQSQSVIVGQNATFSVGATGTAPLNYQWRFNGNAIAGATGTSFTRTNAQTTNAGNYTVFVSNSAGSVTSLVATLNVGTPPSITSQPQLQSVTAGQDATFSVIASGTAPMNYQWRLNGNAIAGATGTSYTRTNAQNIDAGSYTVLVTNAYGTALSLGATLTVLIPPSIVTQPVPQTVTAGQSATFSVVVTGTAPMRYVWRLNGASIFGATNSTYTVNNAQLADAGNYSVVVLNEVGLTVSTSAALTVNPAIPPSIVTQPLSQTVIAGQSASFSVVATGTAPLRYQWRLNNNNINGATNSSYTVSSAQVANAGNYTVLVSNGGGELLSSNATLNVNYSLTLSVTANGGTINTSPAQSSYAPGTQVTLTAVPRSGYRFVNWQSGLSGSANPATVTMNANLSVQAKFQKN